MTDTPTHGALQENEASTTATPHAEQELINWLTLFYVPGVGPKIFYKLLEAFGSIEHALTAEFFELKQLGIREPIAQDIKSALMADPHQIKKQVEQTLLWQQQNNQQVLLKSDEKYPDLLKQVHNCPVLLFVRGDVDSLNKSQLAMVGSRNPTIYGQEQAKQFAKFLAEKGFVITSGLALGVDGASHQGALSINNTKQQAHGKTIAVLGTGADIIYPKSHQLLAEQIIENGAIVSEFPLGTQAKPQNFPRRNRIISGLALGTIVVEAALKSGSLITAKYALEQNREVFAIPGSIHNPLVKGCHQLIRQGAKLVETAEHVLEELEGMKAYEKEKTVKSFSQADVKPVTKPYAGIKQQCELSEQELHVIRNITFDPSPIDVIINRTGMAVNEVSSLLTQLEIKGCIQGILGGYSLRSHMLQHVVEP